MEEVACLLLMVFLVGFRNKEININCTVWLVFDVVQT